MSILPNNSVSCGTEVKRVRLHVTVMEGELSDALSWKVGW